MSDVINIQARDATLSAFITYGEGWHNYHHCFPWDYKAAELNSGFNSSRKIIELLEKNGWAYDLKTASTELVLAKAKRFGDGSYEHEKYDLLSEDCNGNVLKKDNKKY